MSNTKDNIVPKPEAQWTADDEKKWAYDWRARNILISAFRVDEYYTVSHCTTVKEMWDALQVTYDGTNEVKQSRINTLTQEEWKPKVTVIKEANDLTTLDITTLFGKLEEHQEELASLEKYEKTIKKEKIIDKESEKKSIALVASSSKSSNKEQSDSDSSSEEDSDDEEMRLFVRRDYKPDCPQLKKDKGKAPPKKYNKQRRAYITWESDSESSSDESSSDSDKTANLSFEKLHTEALATFKSLSSDKQIFSFLEGKVYKTEKDLDIDGLARVQNCGACHIWKGEVKSLKAKLEKALQPKVTFVIDPNLFKKSLNPSYAKYSFVEKIPRIPMRKSKRIHHHGLCHYCSHSGHTIAKRKFRKFLVECLASEEREQFLDSGCSRHMMGDISLFIDFKAKKKGYVTYGDNNK
ncbi:uncharacterized protein LOC127095266 [Lathyrus oleraceus]|uniref:uncharacterized protein LOC127095266 n=1 Tax=Pisum sativum TaxID=3888 RepID=UPI0021D057CE|nr:uncharacterized protein LOC127095266 [Pisum sativum]